MELKDFVTETLNQIISGVKSSQEFAQREEAVINGTNFRIYKADSTNNAVYYDSLTGGIIQLIDFDIAINITESQNAKGGIGIFVGSIGLGTQGEAYTGNNTVNRIKFSVPLRYPFQQQPEIPKTSSNFDPKIFNKVF